MKRSSPLDTPLDEWPSGWLKLEMASILDNPMYIMMREDEKHSRGWPVTDQEMREVIRTWRHSTSST